MYVFSGILFCLYFCLIYPLSWTRDVVNLWRGSNPDYNANKTAVGVALALKQINQQPQNTASSRARYMVFVVPLMLSEILYIIFSNCTSYFFKFSLFSIYHMDWLFKTSLILSFHWHLTIILNQNKFKSQAVKWMFLINKCLGGQQWLTADLPKRKKKDL